jgi:hypothetical protein
MIAFDLAISELKKSSNPIEKIIANSAYWIPLQWVYVQMVQNRDITRLSELSRENRLKYWEQVRGQDWQKWKKIAVSQALYVYDKINQYERNNINTGESRTG